MPFADCPAPAARWTPAQGRGDGFGGGLADFEARVSVVVIAPALVGAALNQAANQVPAGGGVGRALALERCGRAPRLHNSDAGTRPGAGVRFLACDAFADRSAPAARWTPAQGQGDGLGVAWRTGYRPWMLARLAPD
ncbi:hypothetical protein [Sphingomonas sp. S2-65]|uniref:hypothetical protein n=1 Tax=Sphingomonas sp. S2-65 TaxID=2903960 RepID=UPI001F1E0C47|nr:hypothetical protein [Sphingomonas sp. S2-65]UYY56937.1 hypothetical protein LZ586_09525 [Sphingomonas sp. S2-65]